MLSLLLSSHANPSHFVDSPHIQRWTFSIELMHRTRTYSTYYIYNHRQPAIYLLRTKNWPTKRPVDVIIWTRILIVRSLWMNGSRVCARACIHRKRMKFWCKPKRVMGWGRTMSDIIVMKLGKILKLAFTYIHWNTMLFIVYAQIRTDKIFSMKSPYFLFWRQWYEWIICERCSTVLEKLYGY